MQMKTDVSWPFLSESVARFFFEPSLSTFYEDHDKECALIKQKQLPEVFCEKKCS